MGRRPVLYRTFFFVTLAWFALAGASARAACTGPQALEAKVRAHPTAAAWAELGNWFGDQKQFACAAEALRSAVRLDPKSAQLTYLLGLAYYEQEKFDDAVPPLQRSVATDGTALKPHLLLASALMHISQPQDAAEQWRASLAIDSGNSMAMHGLSECYVLMGSFPDEIELLKSAKLDDHLAVDLAIAYTNTQAYDDAVKTLTTGLAASPNSVELSNALVAVYLKISDTDLAERTAQKCYQAHPDDHSAQVSYMRTLIFNGDWGPARPLAKQLMAEDAHSFDTLYLVGILERQDGDFADAKEHLTAAMALNPSLANLRYNLGATLDRLHDAAGAVVQLQQALSLGDKDPEVHFELANALRATGQTDAAAQEMAAYQAAVQLKQNTVLAGSKAAEAEVNLNKGDVAKAVQLYSEAFAATPKNALLGYKYAMALDKANDLETEHSVLDQVIAIDPEIALAQHQLGYLDSRRGDNASAEKHFERAVEAAPGYTEAWISLAATLGMESKFPQARQAVANALRIEPENAEARELSQELAAAQGQAPSQPAQSQAPHN
ncbi:MAG: tetratricopeptide repeat protein [Acidobacteriaceae bacterium]